MAGKSFFKELKRRNVYKVGAAYLVTAWVLSQVASLALGTFEAPPWILKVLLLFLAIGFPIALIFAWAFELTPEGIKRTESSSSSDAKFSNKRLNWIIYGALGITILGLIIDRFRIESQMVNPVQIITEPAMSPLQRKLKDKSVAVLPFQNQTNNPDYEAFGMLASDYITESLFQVARDRVTNFANDRNILLASMAENEERNWGTMVDVDVLIQGRYYLQESDLIIYGQFVDAKNGNVIHSLKSIKGPTEDKMNMLKSLTQKILGYWTLSDVKKYADDPPKYEAYQKYVEGQGLLNSNSEAALQAFFEAFSLDTTYFDPLTKVVATYSNMRRGEAMDSILTYINSKSNELTEYEQLRFKSFELTRDQKRIEAANINMELAEKYPNDAIAIYQAGFHNLHLNKCKSTLQYFLEMYPINIKECSTCWGHGHILEAYFRLGEYQKMLDYRDSLNFETKDARILNRIIRALVFLEKEDELESELNRYTYMETWQVGEIYNPVNYLENACRAYYIKGDSLLTRKYGEAYLESIKDSLEIEDYQEEYAETLFLIGEYQQAYDISTRFILENPTGNWNLAWRSVLNSKLNNFEEAKKWRDSLEIKEVNNVANKLFLLAAANAHLGEKETAVANLQAAYNSGTSYYRAYGQQWLFKPLYGYPPYEEFMKPVE